jgi:DNA-directed RNA polymerase specialized sigma24 family protein
VLTPSVALLTVGTFMVPGGVFAEAPPPVSIAVIIAGSALVVFGATLGFVPVRWTELAIGGFKGTVETRDQEFRDFYRAHRDQLQRFTTLMCGDSREASELVREASARTRLAWTTGASADPLQATLKSLLHWLEQPSVWVLFVSTQTRRRRRSWRRGKPQSPEVADDVVTPRLAALPFPARAALLLDSLVGLRLTAIADLLDRSEEQVRRDIEAALKDVSPALHAQAEAPNAG